MGDQLGNSETRGRDDVPILANARWTVQMCQPGTNSNEWESRSFSIVQSTRRTHARQSAKKATAHADVAVLKIRLLRAPGSFR